MRTITEERVANVECVQCGTRNEVASEAASGNSQESSASACTSCGAPLEDKASDAPLSDIFNEFERTFHPADGVSIVAATPEAPEPTAPLEAAAGAEAAEAPEAPPEPPVAVAAPVDLEPPSVAALDAPAEVPAEIAPPRSRDDELSLSSERAVESSSSMLAASPVPAWSASNLRASIVDSEWSTPTAAEEPIAAQPSENFAPVASERPPAEPVRAEPEPAPPESAAAAEPPPESAAVAEPAPPESAASVEPPPPSKGPPPPPAWAFANTDPEDSALARALRETAQLRRETGSAEVYPAATFVEAATSGTMQIASLSAAAAESVGDEAEPARARQPSIADSEHPSLADDDDSSDPIPLAGPSQEPFAPSRVETTQRIDAVAPPPRLTSEAPVVRSLGEANAPSGEPWWGAPGSPRRTQVFGAAAALAVIGAFFLGRSSVSESPREDVVALAKPEAPRAAPAAASPPAAEHQAAVESPAAQPPPPAPSSAPSAPSDNGSGIVVVNNPKARVAGAAPGNGPAFDAQAAGRAIADAAARATSCRRLDQPTGRATITVTFGPSGKVSTANIYGLKFPSASVRNCMGSMLYQARVPAFSGAPVTVKKSLKI
jgi:hypothetical protein